MSEASFLFAGEQDTLALSLLWLNISVGCLLTSVGSLRRIATQLFRAIGPPYDQIPGVVVAMSVG
jgi:hypothetical protein